MNFVLDASVALSWCFSDEATPESISLLERLEHNIAYVPELWTLEVGNILIGAEKRKRISYAEIAKFIALLGALHIQTDRETSQRGFHEIAHLAYSEKLTTYDAAYLELAMRLGLALATKDIQLKNAAQHVGVKVIEV